MTRCSRLIPLMILPVTLGVGAGCVDNSPPPPQVAVPRDASEGPLRRSDPVKPMPPPSPQRSTDDAANADVAPPPFDDAALLGQEIPEQAEFVAAYQAVGRPVLLVEGLNRSNPSVGTDRPAYLVFTDWMRCEGAVTVLSERGGDVAPDVVIEFHVDGGGDVEKRGALNLSARAVNASDRVLLGQAMVDLPVPADRQAINRYTRFLARKLMSDMSRTWSRAPSMPPSRRADPVEAPTTHGAPPGR